MRSKRILVISLLTVTLAAGLLFNARGRGESPGVDFSAFPQALGEWGSRGEIEMPDDLMKILDPDAFIFRDYHHRNGKVINLNIIYHLDQRYGAHDPEICYTSQGWTIPYLGEKQTQRFSLGNGILDVNMFHVMKSGRRQVVFYWFFTSGQHQTPSRFMQMALGVTEKVSTGHIGTGFVRISMNIDDNEKEVLRDMEDFTLLVSRALAKRIDGRT